MNRIRHVFVVNAGPAIRAMRSPSFPHNPDGRVLVHIGCGELNDPRYINIDARAMPHVHYVTDNLLLEQFACRSIDLIYACHVLEHVSHQQLIATISSWSSRLKEGGVLRLSVPDFDTILQIYRDQNNSIDAIVLPLLGGQCYDFNYHNSIFNHDYLYGLLAKCGFTAIREWDPANAADYRFEDWARKDFIVGGKKYRISINVEATKYVKTATL